MSRLDLRPTLNQRLSTSFDMWKTVECPHISCSSAGLVVVYASTRVCTFRHLQLCVLCRELSWQASLLGRQQRIEFSSSLTKCCVLTYSASFRHFSARFSGCLGMLHPHNGRDRSTSICTNLVSSSCVRVLASVHFSTLAVVLDVQTPSNQGFPRTGRCAASFSFPTLFRLHSTSFDLIRHLSPRLSNPV